MDHSHSHGTGPVPVGPIASRIVVGILTVVGIAAIVGVALLWPAKQDIAIPLPFQTQSGGAVATESGTVTLQDLGACGSASAGKVFTGNPTPPVDASYECQRSIVRIDSGTNAGTSTLLEVSPGPGAPDLRVGDEIRLVRGEDSSGTPQYAFDDYTRGTPLLVVGLIFAVVIVAVARWRGLRALLGIGVALAVLVGFMLPAILAGSSALLVALIGGTVILYCVLYLAHGVNLRTSSALLGTIVSMGLAALLSDLAIRATKVTGFSEEQNTNVQAYIGQVSITGLLLAGFIIGSLGVLNDVTITQASAAFELAALDEHATRRSIFGSAMRVGRDHIASTVYTLVLAYAGGALPLLLLFSVAGRSIGTVLTGDAVAIEIVRSCVGGIALALSVPLTTGIAVLLARPLGGGKAKSTGGRHSA
ncbi:YibE/F family protein [Actinomycetes bacterium M1A6_2h]